MTCNKPFACPCGVSDCPGDRADYWTGPKCQTCSNIDTSYAQDCACLQCEEQGCDQCNQMEG